MEVVVDDAIEEAIEEALSSMNPGSLLSRLRKIRKKNAEEIPVPPSPRPPTPPTDLETLPLPLSEVSLVIFAFVLILLRK